MFDAGTIIGIQAGSSIFDNKKKTSVSDEKKEICEIRKLIEAAYERLDDLVIRYDAREKDTTELEKAMDALDEAADCLEELTDE